MATRMQLASEIYHGNRSHKNAGFSVFSKILVNSILLITSFYMTTASAAQQTWASQYVSWSFDNSGADVWNIDQQIWIPQPANASFWPLQWSWLGAGGVGGYMGFLQEGNASQKVRFSLWNLSDPHEVTAHCEEF